MAFKYINLNPTVLVSVLDDIMFQAHVQCFQAKIWNQSSSPLSSIETARKSVSLPIPLPCQQEIYHEFILILLIQIQVKGVYLT